MIKIDSAIHREQNCIAYKMGSEIIQNTCGGGGVAIMLNSCTFKN
ncbi:MULTISPECIES: hypothetical protein [Helicobacter]|uniref:Uncharacterized protein n=1 Tax=Helicobacter ibis TaxID=2962633 RepID=A0ABT4VCB0_9HELI|nr:MULTISPECIES: hypothetical protein [Helicobacter]MDA3967586.1 hypothetical protein [Helicobacter sp. WB40]MDA3968339.1 hypothetical protein [Helicobacter ibis]